MSERRASGRLKGEQPAAPPPLRTVKKGSRLASLIARNFKNRKPDESDPAIAWKLDGTSPPNLSFLTSQYNEGDSDGQSAASIENGSVDDEDEPPVRELFDDDDDDDEDYVEELPLDEDSMKLLYFPELKSLFQTNCVCRQCAEKGVVSPLILTQETFGVATDLRLRCEPADRRMESHWVDVKSSLLNNDEQRPSAQKYASNYYLMIAMQLLGLSIDTISVFLAFLGMRPSLGNNNRWRAIQDRLGMAEETVRDEVLLENQEKEIEATLESDPSRCDDDGRVGLTCSLDAGWQKRSSGRTYDSPSGHNLLIGALTKRVLDVQVYCKLCAVPACLAKFNREHGIKTYDDGQDIEYTSDLDQLDAEDAKEEEEEKQDDDDSDDDEDDDTRTDAAVATAATAAAATSGKDKDNDIRPHRCPLNYAGSSKSMESEGAVQLVIRAWRSGTFWVKEVVTDDDSTSRAQLTTDLKAYRQANPTVPRETYWPRYESADGKKHWADNKGKLPVDVRPPDTFWADPTHRQRVYAKNIFELAKQSTKTAVTKNDGLRLKRNWGTACKQNLQNTFDGFKNAMQGAILHHFNDHSC